MGMSGWSSDVRSSDLTQRRVVSDAQLDDFLRAAELIFEPFPPSSVTVGIAGVRFNPDSGDAEVTWTKSKNGGSVPAALTVAEGLGEKGEGVVVVRVTYNYQPVFRSEEHTSELQSLMRISYAVFCLKKTKRQLREHK